MANVTCVKLILWGEPNIVDHLEEHSQFHFLIDENGRASDRFISTLDSHSGSIRSPGRDAVTKLIDAFKKHLSIILNMLFWLFQMMILKILMVHTGLMGFRQHTFLHI